jgi:hypothetical protein
MIKRKSDKLVKLSKKMQFKTPFLKTNIFCQAGEKTQLKTPNFQIDKLVYDAEIPPLAVAAVATAQLKGAVQTPQS